MRHLAVALISLGLCWLVRPAPVSASLTRVDGATGASKASKDAAALPGQSPDLTLDRGSPAASVGRAKQTPSDDLGQFAAQIDPDRILREDFRLTPKLYSTPPGESILLNAQSAAGSPRLPAPGDGATSDDDRSSSGDLAIPLPAIGAGWTLLIGAGMYQFGSRALRLRR